MKSVHEHEVVKVQAKTGATKIDFLAVEEPLQISIASTSIKNTTGTEDIAVTMRTPGADKELAIGFLYGEGLLSSQSEINKVALKENKICLFLNAPSLDLSKLKRNFYTTSSCGVCGKASIAAIGFDRDIPVPSRTVKLSSDLLLSLPKMANEKQVLFHKTGGIHAATLFDLSGSIVLQYEDIGRHNALDKVIGAGFMDDHLPFDTQVLLLSGRASFELLQKAIMAGIQIVIAIGAPSSLAVQLADEYDITLVGFVKKDSFNVYTGSERII